MSDEVTTTKNDLTDSSSKSQESYEVKPLQHDEQSGQPVSQKDDATFWRNMFEALRKERVTKAEKQLEATLQENKRRDEALRTMVKHLEKEKQMYKKRAETAESLLKSTQRGDVNSGTLTEQHAKIDVGAETGKRLRVENTIETKEEQKIFSLQKQILQQSQILELYEILTSTKVCKSPSQTDTNNYSSYDCTVINHEEKKATRFRLSFLKPIDQQNNETALRTINEIRCEPLANAEFLPRFMQDPEPIIFERSQCAVLFKNVLLQMFSEEESTEDVNLSNS
jgi:hypothetical protein